MTTELTISGTVEEIRSALRDYIEATYHVGSPELVSRRRTLLDAEGSTFREPYIESTPRYQTGPSLADLRLPDAATELLSRMAGWEAFGEPLFRDPPYTHQAQALEAAIADRKSLVVATGTGSGKTEAFMLPMLANLAIEARTRPQSFASPAVRTILLYPMNALVNDQLGRLRSRLGHPNVTALFTQWGGRPARFTRYTSRTLYPGVRKREKDQKRLKPIGDFYVSHVVAAAESRDPHERERAAHLIEALRARGKWPAKPDIRGWYGEPGTRWQRNGEFVRAVLGHEDSELLTRHESLGSPPDVLVTNYSMLEYMLMRPLERPIFEATESWLRENPQEHFLLVVDEAHLYRGAAGAEVGLLLRRLRHRLGIPAERLQVICTSASFDRLEYAKEFAAQLTGKSAEEFVAIGGDLALREPATKGTEADARALDTVSLDAYYKAANDNQRREALESLLAYRGISSSESAASALYDALADLPVLNLLVNSTMTTARRLSELGTNLFETNDRSLADRAMTVLVALASAARARGSDAGLLPCRVHAFFRGLPGLWACADSNCLELAETQRGLAPVGTLYAQPRSTCGCGARVFELYTCRHCGSAYLRAYTDDLARPTFLWEEAGAAFRASGGPVTELQALDLLVEEPIEPTEPCDLDLVTGRLNPDSLGERTRRVFIRLDRSGRNASTDDDEDDGDANEEGLGQFTPCGVCGQRAGFQRSSVQDHQTKGDQPFQALITRQLEVQPPGPQAATRFAPLRGRKVLVFSDSRQTAARLAPNLQTYSMQDVLRPVLVRGWQELASDASISDRLNLEDLYFAALVGAELLGVRLRPVLKGTETLQPMQEVASVIERGLLHDRAEILQLRDTCNEPPPESLLRGIITTLSDRFWGLQSLALASLRERQNLTPQLLQLPDIPGLAESDDSKVALARIWMSQWTLRNTGVWFRNMTDSWWRTKGGVRPHSGAFQKMDQWLDDAGHKREFRRRWLPELLRLFCEQRAPGKNRLLARHLALELDGSWAYCRLCRTTQRPFPGVARCVNCIRNTVESVDPDNDSVFKARKGYYRASTTRALERTGYSPMAIIAAEHTAQLNAAQADEVFSKAEEHELLFQDIDVSAGSHDAVAIDVLSSTTTMEVGIDIGTLSGVALRNLPPSRANYQQRAGRAGRRGNAVATVLAFGSADSHDENYFTDPEEMIRGRVEDPTLTLSNAELAGRHVTAFLLQQYHLARLPEIDPDSQPQLFEVLGKVASFRTNGALNRNDFEAWLRQNASALRTGIDDWLPGELSSSDRSAILDGFVDATVRSIDWAIGKPDEPETAEASSREIEEADDAEVTEAPPEEGEERTDPRRSTENLLDRLLYKGVLPRYAFPTDVVGFYVFDVDRSAPYRPEYQYSPSQGLPVALTQYAPMKNVWIDGKLWRSGAIFSPISEDRFQAWSNKKLYLECEVCRYARTQSTSEAERGEVQDCPACGAQSKFGEAMYWMRPPGFAHPSDEDPRTAIEDQPPTSYATRAKLLASGPPAVEDWDRITEQIRQSYLRRHLLVSNTGPRGEGYTYCTRCGRIEPTAIPTGVVAGSHRKPFPDEREPDCPGGRASRGVVLGTDFISDVLLVRIEVGRPVTLKPGDLATDVALRTLSETFSLAATRMLGIDSTELQAEFRPALVGGSEGVAAEIYMYDTLPGGAGFSRRVAELGTNLYREALLLLEDCPAQCEFSCYRCLRSFKNRFEHIHLDRHLGASLLRYLLDGNAPELAKERIETALDKLYEDLCRQAPSDATFTRNARVDVIGIGPIEAPILATLSDREIIVGVHGPLTPDYAADQALRDAKELGTTTPIVLLDEIVVSRSLPTATGRVLDLVRS